MSTGHEVKVNIVVISMFGAHPYLHALLLAVPRPAPLGEVVDGGELDEGGEDEGVAHSHEPVHGRGVRHLGQRVPGADAQRCHGEHSGDPWRHKRTQVTSYTTRGTTVGLLRTGVGDPGSGSLLREQSPSAQL